MILDITCYGNPVLRETGKKIEPIDDGIRSLVEDMIETMHEASGIGLAAQQIGKAIQLAVIDIPAEIETPSRMWIEGRRVDWSEYMPLILINPQLQTVKKKDTAEEGCLSFPGINAKITRPARTTCTCLDLEGKQFTFDADGLLGRAIQHEVDHLNGVLFTDHMDPADKRNLREEIETIRQQGLEQSRESTTTNSH